MIAPDLTWEALHCTLTLRRPAEGVVVLVFQGTDVGELGERPFEAMERILEDDLPLELWIDARATSAASMDVSGGWSRWLAAHRTRLHRVNALCGSELLAVTIEFAGRHSGIERRLRIFRDPAAFDRGLAVACDG